MRRLLLLGLLPLIACGTPQEQCIRGVTKDVRVLDRLISTSRGNLERGYAYGTEQYWDTDYRICGYHTYKGQQRATFCFVDVLSTRTVHVAINLDEEAKTLNSMVSKRAELAHKAQPAIAQCKVLHPEEVPVAPL